MWTHSVLHHHLITVSMTNAINVIYIFVSFGISYYHHTHIQKEQKYHCELTNIHFYNYWCQCQMTVSNWTILCQNMSVHPSISVSSVLYVSGIDFTLKFIKCTSCSLLTLFDGYFFFFCIFYFSSLPPLQLDFSKQYKPVAFLYCCPTIGFCHSNQKLIGNKRPFGLTKDCYCRWVRTENRMK